MKENLKVRSANIARVTMDGQEVGMLQNVRVSDDYSPEPASGIGDIHVQEYVPTMARHTISVGKLALRTKSLLKLGLVPKNGDAALEGMVFDIEIFDKKDGTLIRKCLNCSFASGDLEIQKHAIMSTNCQFYALDVEGGASDSVAA